MGKRRSHCCSMRNTGAGCCLGCYPFGDPDGVGTGGCYFRNYRGNGCRRLRINSGYYRCYAA